MRVLAHPADKDMRKRIKPFMGLFLALLLLVSPVLVQASQADVDRLKEESENASQKVDEINDQKQQAQDAKEDLEDQADALTGQIGQFNSKISSVSSQISNTEESISQVKEDIDSLNSQIETTQASLDSQKKYMKLRIQYMYENRTSNMLVSILESGSLTDFLKRIDYIQQIVSYDNDAVALFEETAATLQEQKEDVEAKQDQLNSFQSQLESQKAQLGQLIDSASSALDTTNSQIDDAQEALDNLEQQLAEAQAYEKKIQSQYEAAQVALAQQLAGQQGGYSGGYSSSDSDVLLLAALIQAEADNQGSTGRLAVGSVVMNRVASSSFPNTISGVIYQSGQFAPVTSGRVALILAQGPNSGCQEAAAAAIAGSTNVDSLFFCTYSYAQQLHDSQVAAGQEGFLDRTEGTVINAHYFYNYK